jgi:predicted TIM-barrel fold metal-dependent hydrolase
MVAGRALGEPSMTTYFFDSHMHAMNLNHPDFVSLVDSIASGFTEFVISGALSPGYLLTPTNRSQQGLITILNMFNVFERPIAEIFMLLEDDLAGVYMRPEEERKTKPMPNAMYPERPYIRDGRIHVRNLTYDRYALVPLVMDFSNASHEWGKSYYSRGHQEKILAYVSDTLQAFEHYRTVRPDGLLEFFPFLGINPEAHSRQYIQELLSTYVRVNRDIPTKPRHHRGNRQFWGVKLYPPLGTDPWPEDDREKMERVETIYDFCCSNDIPVTTHCDDQGFRGVTAKVAQQYTSPATWRKVLEHYPTLRLDFAHYGKQYNPLAKPPLKALLENTITSEPWFKEIILLMQEYPNIFADFSFTGTDPRFYDQLKQYVDSIEDRQLAGTIMSRSLFGSDFTVNLSKVESYSNYLRIFEASPFSDEEIDGFARQNPMAFLRLDTPTAR